MIKRAIVSLIALTIGLCGFSQNQFAGKIIDTQTKLPVVDAHLMLAKGWVSTSDSSGMFSIPDLTVPSVLRITHVAYGQHDVMIEKIPNGIYVIELKQNVSEIDEVQISAERLRILTKLTDYSLQDFAFDVNGALWLVGYINNNPAKGRLWLANHYADTISSLAIEDCELLYLDVFQNVHLVTSDTSYQLFGYSEQIQNIDRISKSEFISTIAPVKAHFEGKLIYQKYVHGSEGLHTYYYSALDSVPKFLCCIRDTIEENIQEYEYVFGHAGMIYRAIIDMEPGIERMDSMRALRTRQANKKQMFNRRVQVPVLARDSCFYIINLYKDSLLMYDREGKFSESRAISFHQEIKFGGIDYKEFKLIMDQVTHEVFCLERRTTEWILNRVDLDKGILMEKILLPRFPGMKRITVYNKAVYFLYHEKHYPYYVRLYRYQLD
jgi:hypothetical protein